ncbi:MAG: DUF3347 domain-containing protein [Eudoraea sp.]|uniref:DUF3347 domain-containing protein n=1 Tax=Eudoraea sp. TaxID=1979955 RepID=UPI003C759B39
MKRRVTLTITTIIVIFLASCGDANKKQGTKMNTPAEIEAKKESSPKIADASFSDGMTGKVFQNYQQIRMALVNSDAEEVNLVAGNLAESFNGEKEEMKSMAMAMADAKDIEKQRELFSQFTGKVEPLFKESISEGAIYKQFCPMAFDGKGGYWISDVEEIRNPYYGEKMLKCGKVTETIK